MFVLSIVSLIMLSNNRDMTVFLQLVCWWFVKQPLVIIVTCGTKNKNDEIMTMFVVIVIETNNKEQ